MVNPSMSRTAKILIKKLEKLRDEFPSKLSHRHWIPDNYNTAEVDYWLLKLDRLIRDFSEENTKNLKKQSTEG